MNSLPQDCLELIVNKLLNQTPKCDYHKVAASMILVDKQTFQSLAHLIWETIEPGCTQKGQDKHEKDKYEKDKYEKDKHEKDKYEKSIKTIPTAPPQDSKVVILRAFCREIGCSPSGSKQTLNENIAKALKKQIELNKPRKNSCPLSKDAIQCILEKQEKYTTYTNAKSKYLLSDKDLKLLECKLCTNPHYRSGPPMRLYKVVELERLQFKKFQDANAIEKQKGKLKLKREARVETIQKSKEEFEHFAHLNSIDLGALTSLSDECKKDIDKISKKNLNETMDNILQCWRRYRELEIALQEKNCVVRNDSRLCRAYVEGNTTRSLSDIVDTMAEMKFFFTYTNYSSLRDAIAEELAHEQLKYEYYVDWEEVNEEASEKAKIEAVSQWMRRNNPDDFLEFPQRYKN